MTSVFLAIPILKEIQPSVLDSILHSGSGLITHAHVEPEYSKFLDDKRNDCVEKFLQTDCDYLLFWDSDTIANENSLKTLVSHDKDIVSAVIYKKGGDHEPCFGFWDEASRSYQTPMPFPYNELIPVDIAGTGFLLIKRAVLEKVPYPWFKCGDKGQAGEDVYFCVKCKENGFQVWVDTSVHLGHIATPYIVTNETYEMSLLWRMVNTFRSEGRFEEFRKILNDFAGKTPEELDSNPNPDNVYKLTRMYIGYKPSDLLKKTYLYYINEVSKPEWAMSWQLSSVIDRTMRQLKPKRLLDLGSGFSSYLFRSTGIDTVSVDKDPKWLKKTRAFLKKNKLPTTDLYCPGSTMNPAVYLDKKLGADAQFDIILLDYAVEDRVALFEYCRNHGKVIFLDDMHFKAYREEATKFFSGDLVFDLREETTDSFGRYAWMVVPVRK